MLPVKNIRRSIIYLSIAFFIILVLNVSIIVIKNNVEAKNNELNAETFLQHIKSGDFQNARELWPNVFATMKSDKAFLASFSKTLSDSYYKYYVTEYEVKSDSSQLFQICRVYNSFIDENSFNDTASGIHEDYIEEKIDYDTFVSAINDFYFFTEYKSIYIHGIIEDGSVINTSRINFQKALDFIEQADLPKAIDFMKMVSPKDPIYYPLSLENIDSLILQLRDEVKNSK